MKRSRALRSVIFRAIVPLVAACAELGAQPKPRALDLVLQRFREYLEGYNRDYATTVAQERYQQRDGPVDRLLESEFAMVRAGGGDQWLGFRDVLRVDGTDVTGRSGRLAALLTSPSDVSLDLAARIAAESARYNIGPSRRTINNPALVLLVLDPLNHGRMRFSRRGEDRIGRTRVWEIGFVEESRPTIIRTSNGLQDQPIEGRAWIDPEKGTLLRAVLRVDVYQRPREPARSARPPTTKSFDHTPAPVADDRRERLTLDVEFGFDPTIELWVPLRMRERHELGTRLLQSGDVTYSSYRKFVVQTRILP